MAYSDEYIDNGNIISDLTEQLRKCNVKINKVRLEAMKRKKCHDYMVTLKRVLKGNESLNQEWQDFLAVANIPETDSTDYNPFDFDIEPWSMEPYTALKAADDFVEKYENFCSRIVSTQAGIITDLKISLRNREDLLMREINELKKIDKQSLFYQNLQRKLIPEDGSTPDQNIIDAWMTFMMMLKLTLNEEIDGFTR